MNTQTVAQKSFAQAIETFLNELPVNESLCVLCVCQTLHPDFSEACNPFFVFPVSKRSQAIPVIMEWARAFEAVNWMLPALTESFHWDLIQESQLEKIIAGDTETEDEFLYQAACAMKLQMAEIKNPCLMVSPQGQIPKHSDLLQA